MGITERISREESRRWELPELPLPQRMSKWLRRDLIRRVEGLGLPVTAIVPQLVGDASIDAVTETVMSHETWVPKGPRSPEPRIGDERPRGE